MSPATLDNPGVNPGGLMVAQPHGGALKRGGTNPGAGRRPGVVRRSARAMFAKNLPVLDHIAGGVTTRWDEGKDNGTDAQGHDLPTGGFVLSTPKAGERVAAMKLLHEIGYGEQVSVGVVKGHLAQQLAVIRSQATWTSEELMARLAEVWR